MTIREAMNGCTWDRNGSAVGSGRFSEGEDDSAVARLERFDHFLLESNELIPAAGDALVHGDLERLGTIVDQSQQAAEELLGNQIPETSFLARSARELGAVAASAFGAGFGGSVWALVEEAGAAVFEERWRESYLSRFPVAAKTAEMIVTRAGPGVVEIIRGTAT